MGNAFERFINSLPEPEDDSERQAIDQILRTYYHAGMVEEDKRDYLADVLAEMRITGIDINWYFYIKAMIDWLRENSANNSTMMLACFLLGYCWATGEYDED